MDPESRLDTTVPDSHARAPAPLDCRGGRGESNPARDQVSPEVYGPFDAPPHQDARTPPAEARRAHVEEVQRCGAAERSHRMVEEKRGGQ